MNTYLVREICGRIKAEVKALSASDAAWTAAEIFLKSTLVSENVLVFDVEIDDNNVRVSVHLENTPDTDVLHFPDVELEHLEIPLALNLKANNGRSRKIVK